MALIAMNGFDAYDVLDSKGRLALNGADNLFAQPAGRDGVGKCLEILDTGGGSSGASIFIPGANSTVIIGFSFFPEVFPSTQTTLILFRDSAGSTGFNVYLTPIGTIQVRATSFGNYLGTSTDALAPGAWNTLEFKITVGNSGSFSARLNGVVMNGLDNLTGDTLGSGSAEVSSVLLRAPSSNRGIDSFKYDDFWACDTSGSINNDFLGDVRVHTRLPNADAGSNDFTAVGAGTSKADRVSESPDDGDTTYLHSETVGHKERFTFPDLPSGVTDVLGMQALAVMSKEDAGTRTVKQVISGSGATEESGDEVGLANGYAYYKDIFEADPDTSDLWTAADANAVELGIEIVS